MYNYYKEIEKMIADKFKVDFQAGCMTAIYNALVALEERIDKLDIPEGCFPLSHARAINAIQPPQPTPDTGKGEREWILFENSFPEYNQKYWVWGSVLDDDDEGYAIPAKWDKQTFEEPAFYDKHGHLIYDVTHIMPYIPGEPAPEAPKEVK